MIVLIYWKSPLSLIDIGAVGNPPSHWLPLKDEIHLIGFEPNKDECKKLNESGCGYRKSEFLPYAIGQCDEKRPFYITEYHECCSLLKPNFEWLQRFDYGSFFDLKQTIEVETLSLDSIEKFSDLRVDALKIDAQGNELPILHGAESILKDVFLIEVESGLHKNYENETTFEELSPYLKEKGFTCMEVFTQPAQKRKKPGTALEICKRPIHGMRKYLDKRSYKMRPRVSSFSYNIRFTFNFISLLAIRIQRLRSRIDRS